MKLIDLTLTIPRAEPEKIAFEAPLVEQLTVIDRCWSLASGATPYTARVHYFDHWGMAGTYLDFPGHIVETDDGADADSAPLERLYRVDAMVARLDRASGSGAIGAEELAAACPVGPLGPALILNALGARRFDEIEERSVYLRRDAVAWMIEGGLRLLVSDVYESDTDPQDVFLDLFRAGVYTVCCPVNLYLLDGPRVKLTVLPLRYPGVTQLPCRVVAEGLR